MAGLPPKQVFWTGPEDYLNLSDGIWFKKIAMIPLQIYRVAIYVEQGPATQHIRQLASQGFFKDKSPTHVCSAILQGKFRKMIFARMLRNIPMGRFLKEMVGDLQPRLKGTGDEAKLKEFEAYFKPKKIEGDAHMLCMWDGGEVMKGGLYGPSVKDFSNIRPEMEIDGSGFAHAMFGMYLDAKSVTPDIQKNWAKQILAIAG